jgi:hypothetical protein
LALLQSGTSLYHGNETILHQMAASQSSWGAAISTRGTRDRNGRKKQEHNNVRGISFGKKVCLVDKLVLHSSTHYDTTPSFETRVLKDHEAVVILIVVAVL